MRPPASQRGMVLIEVLISIFILTIGLVSLLSLFSLSLASTQTVQQDLIAKQQAVEALESIYTARNTAQVTFVQIQNTPDGIFLAGLQPILAPGPDGLSGTADDVRGQNANANCPGPATCVELPGKDGVLGSGDDVWLPLNNYRRQIVITALQGSLNQITVTVQYAVPGVGAPKSYSVGGYISSYR